MLLDRKAIHLKAGPVRGPANNGDLLRSNQPGGDAEASHAPTVAHLRANAKAGSGVQDWERPPPPEELLNLGLYPQHPIQVTL